MRDPELGRFTAKTGDYAGCLVVAKGGLHMIRGNGTPYFSLTCDVYEKGRDVAGGCMHELILQGLPHLKPLADLHLSNILGAPSYGSANAWYWLAGAMGGVGERYHGGNSEPIKSSAECLRIFADYVRVSTDEAARIRDTIVQPAIDAVSFYARTYENGANKPARAALTAWCETQRPRWKNEADDCIATLGLVVYGDTYTPEQVPA